jgi:hypothetical protein
MQADHKTPARRPPARQSDEADSTQLRQARAEGAAYLKAVEYMASEVADGGGTARAGDYLVGWAQERAEGMYHLMDGKLVWMDPAEGENCHIEITVMDAADRRFIPYLDIEARLSRAGHSVRVRPHFLWHPGLYHYGANITLPGAGTYDLEVHIAAPKFHRHDKINGKRYAEDVQVTFRGIEITTGRE